MLNISDDMSAVENKLSFESNCSYDSPDSWCDVSLATGSEDLLISPSDDSEMTLVYSKYISPEVFSPGSSIMNSPASVLERHKSSVCTNANTKNTFYNFVSAYEDKIEEENGFRNEKLGNLVNDQNNNDGIKEKENCRSNDENGVIFGSSESLSPKQKIGPPSPAFNRNPSYFTQKCSNPNYDYGSFSWSPLFSSSPRFSNGQVFGSKLEKSRSLSSPAATFDSMANFPENGFKWMDPEVKRKQAHHNRILEQERERVERLRLEEILTACSDYEKQSQYDRNNKTQIRIKTNGSLSRDKQSPSPRTKTPESPNNCFVFTMDKTDVSSSNIENNSFNNGKSVYHSSPRTRIRTVPSPKVIRKDYTYEIIDQDKTYDLLVRQANIPNDHYISQNSNNSVHTQQHGGTDDVQSLTSVPHSKILQKYEFLGIDPKIVIKEEDVKLDEVMYQSYHESLLSNNESCKRVPSMSVSLINFETNETDFKKFEFSNCSSNEYIKSKSQILTQNNENLNNSGDIEKLNGFVSELNSTTNEKENSANTNKFILPLDDSFNEIKESKFILPLQEIDNVLRRQRFSSKKCELKKLQNEQIRLLDAINKVKSKSLDIQQQKDEIIRELEMEKALLEAELKSENEKLDSEEQILKTANDKINHFEKNIELCSKQQSDRRNQNKSVMNEQKDILNVLQSTLSSIKNESDKMSIIESIQKSREILEEETKSFEDFEFKLLEEEASLLSKRDELHGELNRISNDIERTRMRISGLYAQKEQLLQNASDEIKSLELQVRCHTHTLKQNHDRLQEISKQLKETSKYFDEIFEEGIDSCDSYSYKTQSQEDLDRISRVTSDAPIIESSCTNYLGRRTIASLQQIERSRQWHLAQQGSQVIEEERKRMSALKQRVQDEVKAQWEEKRKQRENNYNSVNSVGSNSCCVLSSDRLTNNLNNDEKLPVDVQSETTRVIESGNALTSKTSQKYEKNEERGLKKRHSNAEPISTNSEDTLVKLRVNKSLETFQRPELRFSVYKRQSLDLRQHIESAGHQVSECPHVFVDKTSCRGYLQKMTTKFRSWNKRWFVFDRKKCSFTYYNDKSEKKLKGGAYFQGLLDLCIDSTNSIRSPNSQATFIVKSTERIYYLLAPSVDAMRIWFDVLATEIETYQDT